MMRTVLLTKDRLESLHIHSRLVPIKQRFGYLRHLCSALEQQVTAVFELIGGVLVTKMSPDSLLRRDGVLETGLDAAVAHRRELRNKRFREERLRKRGQSRALRNLHEAVALLHNGHTLLDGLPGQIIVTVQDDLRRKGRMAADLNGDMAPLGVKDMKGEMIDEGIRLLTAKITALEYLPNGSRRSSDDNEEQAFLDGSAL